MACAFGFLEYEGRCEYAATDEQAEGFGGGLGRCDSAEIEAYENHDGEADDGDAAELVHDFDADEEVGTGAVHV